MNTRFSLVANDENKSELKAALNVVCGGRWTRLWREEAGDDTITVVKVFRRLLNRKKFIATIEEAVARRRRLERLRADGQAVRNLLEPIGWGGASLKLG